MTSVRRCILKLARLAEVVGFQGRDDEGKRTKAFIAENPRMNRDMKIQDNV
jgi:hypothetical protein